jgi:hypothetical protein
VVRLGPLKQPADWESGNTHRPGASHLIVEWLAKVKAYWPECPAVVTRDRRFLMVHSSRKSPAIRAIDPPVLS